MNEIIKWQGSNVEVQAHFVPRFLWTTATIDVFLEEQCILRTGGQFKFVGSHSSSFTHAGVTHVAEVSWDGSRSFSLFSFPYRLRIDGTPIAAARAHIRNWPLGLTAAVGMAAVLATLFHFVFAARIG